MVSSAIVLQLVIVSAWRTLDHSQEWANNAAVQQYSLAGWIAHCH
jgi:heme-degrading monooxygenase HmoA